MRALGIDPVHGTRATFRALCDATSRPGTVVETGNDPSDRAVVATLADHEVSVWTDDEDLRSALERRGRLTAAPPADADLLHVRGRPDWDVRECQRGTLVEPSRGATVVYRVRGLGDAARPALTGVRLSGPGVDGIRRLGVGLPAAELERLAAAQSTYPRGVDAYFTAGDRIAAVPRSGDLEVL